MKLYLIIKIYNRIDVSDTYIIKYKYRLKVMNIIV